jgi:prophage regulatory protein
MLDSKSFKSIPEVGFLMNKQPRENRILRLPAVSEKVGLSKSAIRDRVKRRDFPTPVQLGERAIGFVADEVETWLVERMQCRCAHV